MLASLQPRLALAPQFQPPGAPRRNNEMVDFNAQDTYTFHLPSAAPGVADAVPQSLPGSQAPKLERPVLMVHGYNGSPGTWENMTTWMTRDGQNTYGGVVKASDTAPLNHDAKIFQIQFTKPYDSVETNAAELRTVIDRISQQTGSKEIDVVAHSMGGLDARLYLDQGNEKIDKLVMLATPNHGSVLADIELGFRDMGVPMFPPNKDPEVRKALSDLSEVRKDGKQENNPFLAELNKNFQRQHERADMLTISGNGTPTLANRFLLTYRGDGVVSQKSSRIDGVPNQNIWVTTHTGIHENADAMQLTADFLTGKALPLSTDEPPNVPEDQNFTPQKVSADSEQVNYNITPTSTARNQN